MEFKINFIFSVMLIFIILCIVCFVHFLIQAVKDNISSLKNMDKKLYCHNCKLSYTDAPEYNFCPICGNELQYLDSEKDNVSSNKGA